MLSRFNCMSEQVCRAASNANTTVTVAVEIGWGRRPISTALLMYRSFCAQHVPHEFAQAGGDVGALESEGYRDGQPAERGAWIIAFAGKDDAITMPRPRLHLARDGD